MTKPRPEERRSFFRTALGGLAALLGLPAVASTGTVTITREEFIPPESYFEAQARYCREEQGKDFVFIQKARYVESQIPEGDPRLDDQDWVDSELERRHGQRFVDYRIGTIQMWAGPTNRLPKGWERITL